MIGVSFNVDSISLCRRNECNGTYLQKNNVLVLEFDKYGILKKKELSTMENMKNLTFAKNITENEIRKENFVYSFLSSVRQKMQTQRKD